MKKLILKLLPVIACIQLSAQNVPNPYASIGKKAPKVATLTNGEYEEFFNKDSLVQIGSTVMNRYTGEVAFFAEDKPEMFKAFLEHNEKNFRFLSVDPLTSKYPELTPYQFASNTPIKAVDLDGLESSWTPAGVAASYAGYDLNGNNQEQQAETFIYHFKEALKDPKTYKDGLMMTAPFGAMLMVGIMTDGIGEGAIARNIEVPAPSYEPIIQVETTPSVVAEPVLTKEQSVNLSRFNSKVPANSTETKIYDLPGNGKAFQAESPGQVEGSKAIYEKQVDANGKTTQYTKTTIDPQGNVVHVKDKLNNSTTVPENNKTSSPSPYAPLNLKTE